LHKHTSGFQTTKPAFIYVYQNKSTIKVGVTNWPKDRGERYFENQGINVPALIDYQGSEDTTPVPSIEDMESDGLDPFSVPDFVDRTFRKKSAEAAPEVNQAEKSWVSQKINQQTEDSNGNPQPGLLALRIERNILSFWQGLDLGPTVDDNEHYTETITVDPSQAGGGIASELTFEFHVFLIQKMIQNGGCMEGLIRKLDDADKQELLQHFDYDPNKLYATFSTPVTDEEGNYLVDRQRRVIRKTSDLGEGLGLNFTIHRGRITGIGDIWEEQWQGQKSQQVRKSPELKGFKYDPKVNPDYMQRLLSGGSTPSAQFREGYKDSLNEQQLQFIYDMYEWLNQNSEAIHKDELGNCFIKGQEDRGPVMTAEWHNWAQNELAKRIAVDPNQPADPVEQIEPMQQTSSWNFKTANDWEGFDNQAAGDLEGWKTVETKEIYGILHNESKNAVLEELRDLFQFENYQTMPSENGKLSIKEFTEFMLKNIVAPFNQFLITVNANYLFPEANVDWQSLYKVVEQEAIAEEERFHDELHNLEGHTPQEHRLCPICNSGPEPTNPDAPGDTTIPPEWSGF
jgi:hypothetical protein